MLTNAERFHRWPEEYIAQLEKDSSYLSFMQQNQEHTLDEAAAYFKPLNIRTLFRGHDDVLDPVKFTIPGICYPMYPFHVPHEKTNKYFRSYYTAHEVMIMAIIQKRFSFLRPENLYQHGFLIKDFMATFKAPVCVTTVSNAGPIKFLNENGCVILTVGQSWEESHMRAIILPAA